MFYNHEVLTSRRHGVATVWLVATLGSRSQLKKVTRKAILDVDVPEACKTITDPSAPMALRVQGNLLYGLSRVYSRQCGYVLDDTQSLRDKMRSVAQIAKEMEIDQDVGKTRSDQLNLPEDPAFVPDLDMDFDLSIFAIPSEASDDSNLTSRRSLASSQTSLGPDQGDGLALQLPPPDATEGFGDFDFDLGGSVSSALNLASKAGYQSSTFEESAVIEHPDFEIDDEGCIQVIHPSAGREHTVASISKIEARALSESGISIRVRAEHEPERAGSRGFGRGVIFDHVPVLAPDDGRLLPPAQSFSSRQSGGDEVEDEPSKFSSVQSFPTSEEKTESVEVLQSGGRLRKPLAADERTELSNRLLGEWNDNYLANMTAARRIKERQKSLAHAKKIAAFWVLGQGICGVEINSGADRTPHPLAIFSGQELLNALTRKETPTHAGTKRRSPCLDNGQEETDEPRRVRPRTGEDGGAHVSVDGDGLILGGKDHDDDVVESEVGRHAPPSLQEHSAMPWNISVSRHGSGQPFRGTLGAKSSVGGLASSIELGPPRVWERRASRLTSASPLLHKGRSLPRLPSLEIQDPSQFSSADDALADLNLQLGPGIDLDEIELYRGQSAPVGTHTAVQSQWLHDEAYNFLTFLQAKIQSKAHGEGGDGEHRETAEAITFDELLPPTENTAIVGAQALLHVLALATKGFVAVRQEEPFDHIEIFITSTLGYRDQEPLA